MYIINAYELIPILKEYTQMVASEITEQSLIKEELSLCSYDLMAIFASVEEKTGIELNFSNLSKVQTVKDMLDVINSELEHRKASV